jgi:hypothetical protein
VIAQFDAGAAAGLGSGVAGQLQPLERYQDRTALHVQRRGKLVGRRRAAIEQLRHDREVAALERQDLGGDFVERIRAVLKAGHGPADGLGELRTTHGGPAGHGATRHIAIIARLRVPDNVAPAADSKIQQCGARDRKTAPR